MRNHLTAGRLIDHVWMITKDSSHYLKRFNTAKRNGLKTHKNKAYLEIFFDAKRLEMLWLSSFFYGIIGKREKVVSCRHERKSVLYPGKSKKIWRRKPL